MDLKEISIDPNELFAFVFIVAPPAFLTIDLALKGMLTVFYGIGAIVFSLGLILIGQMVGSRNEENGREDEQ